MQDSWKGGQSSNLDGLYMVYVQAGWAGVLPDSGQVSLGAGRSQSVAVPLPIQGQQALVLHNPAPIKIKQGGLVQKLSGV